MEGESVGHITVDVPKLAKSLYELHLETCGDSLALHLGMLDAKIMTSVERMLKERIPDVFYFAGDPLNERNGLAFRNGVMQRLCAEILKLAKQDGVLHA
jgi:hypothetical protein